MKKIYSYLGFAKKSGNLISGTNTCQISISKIKLLIISKDMSENGKEKMIKLAEKNKIPYRLYGQGEELSRAVGTVGRNIFGITYKEFADVIVKTIDADTLTEKEVF